MPVLRSAFSALVEPGKSLRLTATSTSSYQIFISSATPKKRQGAAADDNGAQSKASASAACTTLYVKAGGRAFAVAAVDASTLDSQRVRVAFPVTKQGGEVEVFVRGPDAVWIAGDQHTTISREQVDMLGSKLADKA